MKTSLGATARRALVRFPVVALLACGVSLAVSPANADQGSTITYTVGSAPLSVNETTAIIPDPVYHQALRTQPLTCSLLPECRFFLLDLSYPANADPNTPYFITVTATLHGTATYELALFGDPMGNSAQVSGDSGSGAGGELHTHLFKHSDDPIQEYGITMFMSAGALTDFTLTFSTSTVAPVTPFESLNPTIPPVTIPPPIDTTPPPTVTTLAPRPAAASAPTTVAPTPPPAQVTPDSALADVFTDNSKFDAALAPQGGQLFKKAAAVTPPGKPNSIQLWLALLALPLGLLGLFPVLIRRARRASI